MKKIKVYFTDFWKGFSLDTNFFLVQLSKKYEVVLDPVNPEYLFYSSFGNKHFKYKNAIKIYFTGENNVPDFNICDYGIGSSFITFEDRYFRLPLYALLHKEYDKLSTKMFSPETAVNRKFCNFVFSNGQVADPIRKEFFLRLSEYKRIDSGGKYLNNIGKTVIDKIDFIKNYKFTIAFENSSLPGYTTEKLLDPMRVCSIPIYWGNSKVEKDFNKNSFVWVKDHKSIDKAIEEIIHLDNNDENYIQKLNQPWLNNPSDNHLNNFSVFLKGIIDQPLDKAKRTTEYGFVLSYLKSREIGERLMNNRLIKQLIK